MPALHFPRSTVRGIADAHRFPIHCVNYVIRSRGIEPLFRAGNCRVFSDEAVAQIVSEVQQIEAKRESGSTDSSSEPDRDRLRTPEDDETEFKEAYEQGGGFCIECGRPLSVPSGMPPLCPTTCFRKRYPQFFE